MMKSIFLLLGSLTALILSSCSSSSPLSRIEKNPQIFSELNPQEQQLVSQGQIEENMSPGGVFLALGTPDRRLEGSQSGKRTMRWDYSSLAPIHLNHFYGGFGRGFGRRGRFGNFGHFGFGPSVQFVPVRSGTVWFENDRVRSWERVRN